MQVKPTAAASPRKLYMQVAESLRKSPWNSQEKIYFKAQKRYSELHRREMSNGKTSHAIKV